MSVVLSYLLPLAEHIKDDNYQVGLKTLLDLNLHVNNITDEEERYWQMQEIRRRYNGQ